MVIKPLLLEFKRNARSYILAPAFSPASIPSYTELVLREERAGTFTHAAHWSSEPPLMYARQVLQPLHHVGKRRCVSASPTPFPSEDLCAQTEWAASPRGPDIGRDCRWRWLQGL